MINWIAYFEEKVKPQLAKDSRITKSYFKEEDITNFGDLVRFVVETNNKEGIIDCYSTGTTSIEVYDFSQQDQIFICLSFPFEIERIEQSFSLFIEAMK